MRSRRSVHERLSSQKTMLGLLQTVPNSAFAEMAGLCGYDFLMLDGEHGMFNENDFLETLRTLAAVDAAALVRISGHNTQALGRYMDMGADAIIVPNVSTAEQAKELVRAMVYPPMGTRGFGASLHRVTRYGMDTAAHLHSPRENVCLLVIIESARGVSNVEEIIAVEGVDGIIIGPFDLSADFGCAGDFAQPALAQAVSRIERAVAEQGKIIGTAPHPGAPIETLVGRGHRLLIIGADMSLMREAMNEQLAKVRSLVDS